METGTPGRTEASTGRTGVTGYPLPPRSRGWGGTERPQTPPSLLPARLCPPLSSSTLKTGVEAGEKRRCWDRLPGRTPPGGGLGVGLPLKSPFVPLSAQVVDRVIKQLPSMVAKGRPSRLGLHRTAAWTVPGASVPPNRVCSEAPPGPRSFCAVAARTEEAAAAAAAGGVLNKQIVPLKLCALGRSKFVGDLNRNRSFFVVDFTTWPSLGAP